MNRRIGVLTGLLLLGVGTIFAAEGRKEIFRPVVLSGAGITGKYFVSRDITHATDIIIDIVGSGSETIEIDLNGFTLSSGSTTAVIRATGLRRLKIHNGSAILTGTTGNVVDVTGNTPPTNDSLTVDGLAISGGGTAILNNNMNVIRITNNEISGSIVDGIVMQESSKGFDGRIANNNLARLNSGPSGTAVGIKVVPAGFCRLIVEDNTIIDALGGGIHVTNAFGVAIRGNVMRNSAFTSTGGIKITSTGLAGATQIVGNVVSGQRGSNAHGIHLLNTRGVRVADNVLENNDGAGILVQDSSDNTIEGNTIVWNRRLGIWFRGSTSNERNTYRRNTIRNNFNDAATVCTTTVCGAAQVCDDGTDNRSFGDNMGDPAPGPC